jgi:hypothetical protein
MWVFLLLAFLLLPSSSFTIPSFNSAAIVATVVGITLLLALLLAFLLLLASSKFLKFPLLTAPLLLLTCPVSGVSYVAVVLVVSAMRLCRCWLIKFTCAPVVVWCQYCWWVHWHPRHCFHPWCCQCPVVGASLQLLAFLR